MSYCAEVAAPVWEVYLPDRRATAIGAAKPRATVVVRAQDGGDERLYVPMAVGKLLRSKQKSGELQPSSRRELLDRIRSLEHVCAMARIERLINRRDYARSELEQKLGLDGYRADTIADCVDRACEIGLVSDRRYADVFIRSKLGAGWGIGRIGRELGRRGIAIEEVAGWPYDYVDPDDELSRAVAIAERRHVVGDRAYQKLVRFLCSRGFAIGVATRAAAQVLG